MEEGDEDGRFGAHDRAIRGRKGRAGVAAFGGGGTVDPPSAAIGRMGGFGSNAKIGRAE